jgi:hypothetical protein
MTHCNSPKAFRFFTELEAHLNDHMPAPEAMRRTITDITKQAKASTDTHKRYPEQAFLNEFVTPRIHSFLTEKQGYAKDDAAKALLSESSGHLTDITSGSPARRERHPFQKVLGVSAEEVMHVWRGQIKSHPLTQSCPDLALRAPFTTVIEGKYFSTGSAKVAEKALVSGIYQSFFYLGLSKLPATKTHPAWDYEYACLIAYDASPEGTLPQAWAGLNPEVRCGCWNGANIFVMILSGNERYVAPAAKGWPDPDDYLADPTGEDRTVEFSILRADGKKPEDVPEEDREEYAAWLKKNGTAC